MQNRKVYISGDLVPDNEAKISIYDSAVLLGDTVTESTRTFNYKPFKLIEHVDRLYKSLKLTRIDSGMTKDEMIEVSENLLAVNKETYEEDWNETFSSPTPDEIKSNTHQLIYGSMLVSVVLLVLLLVDFWKQHSGFWLTLGRRLLSFTSMTMVVTIFVMILILLPISWFSTSAGDPELYSENDNSEAFLAHTNFEAETSLGVDGFVLEFEGGGDDIGMVRPANRSAVEAEPPAPGTVDAESYIGVKGEVSTTPPDFLETTMYLWMALWVLIPFLLMVQQRIAIDSNLAPLKFLEEE